MVLFSFVMNISGAKFEEHCFNISRDIITQASVGKPESENATVLSQKGGHGPRRSMRRPRKLGTRNATLLACDRIRCFESFGKYRAIYVHLAYKRCRSFSERVGPRIIFFKASQVSSCSKCSRGITTEPIACGFCCYLIFQ